jgi:hypothetical protein
VIAGGTGAFLGARGQMELVANPPEWLPNGEPP